MKKSLGDRMKGYERITDFHISPRVPIIGRIDGVAFHTLVKKLKLERPFDEYFVILMSNAAKELASKIQGCMVAYTQSDEISFFIRTDQSDPTTPWFDNRIQKISSVAASIISASFNRGLVNLFEDAPLAAFDCRVYSVPDLIEVSNYFIWRQNDCTKNSINTATHFELSKIFGKKTTQKMMHGLNRDQQQELLWKKAFINWNDYPLVFKRGTLISREKVEIKTDKGQAIRNVWAASAAPIISSEEGREKFFSIIDPTKDGEDG